MPLSERGKYEGLLGSVWALASAIGPPFGGALSTKGHWRWLFYLNIPLSIISFALVSLCLVNRAPQESMRSKLAKMDWAGNVTIIASLVCLTLALTWGGSRYPWISGQVLGPLITGALLLIAFFVYEMRFAKWPTIPANLVSSGTAKSAYLSTFLHGLVSMSVIYVLPSYFQACLRATPLRSGVMILPLALTTAPFAILGAVIIEETQRYIAINYVGWLSTVMGVALLTLLKVSAVCWEKSKRR